MKNNKIISKINLCKILLVLSLTIIFMTSCGEKAGFFSEKPQNQEPTTSQQSIDINSNSENTNYPIKKTELEELFNENHTLEIIKNGEKKAYVASEILAYTVRDILSKAEEVYNNGTHSLPDYNNEKYDYLLRYSGLNDIFVRLDDNTFYIQGNSQIYKLWGSTEVFWNGLIRNESNGSIDLSENLIECMSQSYQHDINEDGIDDDIRLMFIKSRTLDSNGKLVLKVNNSEIDVEREIGWSTVPYRIMNESPSVKFISGQDGKRDLIAIMYSWMTNGVGSTGQIHLYDYKNSGFNKLSVDVPEMAYKYINEKNVEITFPQINDSILVNSEFDDTQMTEDGKTLKDVLNEKEAVFPHTLEYTVMDYNGDGKTELCSVDLLRVNHPRYILCSIYTFYKAGHNGLDPVKVIFLPPYNEKDKEYLEKSEVIGELYREGFMEVQGKNVLDNKDFITIGNRAYVKF